MEPESSWRCDKRPGLHSECCRGQARKGLSNWLSRKIPWLLGRGGLWWPEGRREPRESDQWSGKMLVARTGGAAVGRNGQTGGVLAWGALERSRAGRRTCCV